MTTPIEYDAWKLRPYLDGERFSVTPFMCRDHKLEHLGWDFQNTRCSSIRMVSRCIYCGKMAYGIKTYNSTGKNSFDLEDEELVKSGIIGPYWLDWKITDEKQKGLI